MTDAATDDDDSKARLPHEPDNRPEHRHMDLCRKLALALHAHADTGDEAEIYIHEVFTSHMASDLYRIRAKSHDHGGETDITTEALTEPELAAWIHGWQAAKRGEIEQATGGDR